MQGVIIEGEHHDGNNEFAPEMWGTLASGERVIVRYLSEGQDFTPKGSISRECRMCHLASKYVRVLIPLREYDHNPPVLLIHSIFKNFLAVKTVIYPFDEKMWRISQAKNGGLLTPTLCKSIASEVVEMVRALHKHGIIHTMITTDSFIIKFTGEGKGYELYLDHFFKSFITGEKHEEQSTCIEQDITDVEYVASYVMNF
jgi:hypothetical protein